VVSCAVALLKPGLMVSQGHSGANHQNKVDDLRNNELFVAIEEIRRLRPDIFVLENVPGMKRDRDVHDNNVEGEISNFAVEGIRGLRDIGYQVRLVQLDARSFGSPQNRVRLFLICAKKGVPLPSIPQPTHANPHLARNIFDGGSISNRTFYVGDKGDCGSAPYPAVTVRDAISDLPRFEYMHGDNDRQTSLIPRFNPLKANGNRVGFLQPEPYRTSPVNDFQARQRGGTKKVENHYTPPWTRRELKL
jgi:DNA (cytosine-5)-methyltransferase 1